MKSKSFAVFYISVFLIVALPSIFVGCAKSGGPKNDPSPAVPVQTAVAVRRDVPRQIESIGNVQSLRSVGLKSQVDGIIAKIHFVEGDEVKAGDLLVTLDRRPFENGVRMARGDLVSARTQAQLAAEQAERYKNLDRQGLVSNEEYARLQSNAAATSAQLQSKEAAVANAELQLSYSEIRAPISGRTGQLLLHEGALVQANDTVQTIVMINQLAPIAVAYSVPETTLADIPGWRRAQDVVVSVTNPAAGVAPHSGRLDFIDNTVDPATGTIVLKAVFENRDHALWPGQFVQVQTQTGLDASAIVVPASTVQIGQGNSAVFVVKADQSVELRSIKVLRTFSDSVIVVEMKEAETVVTADKLRLIAGINIKL